MRSTWNCRKEKQNSVHTIQYNSSINNCWSTSTSYFHFLQHSSSLNARSADWNGEMEKNSLLLERPTRIGIIIITAIVLFSLFSDTALFSSSVFASVYSDANVFFFIHLVMQNTFQCKKSTLFSANLNITIFDLHSGISPFVCMLLFCFSLYFDWTERKQVLHTILWHSFFCMSWRRSSKKLSNEIQ